LRPLRAFEQRTLAVEIFGTTGSKACGEIERHAGLEVQITEIKMNAIPVGASLLAMAASHSTLMSTDLTLSRASSLPQGFCIHSVDAVVAQTAAL
jgi:hypothetical protein